MVNIKPVFMYRVDGGFENGTCKVHYVVIVPEFWEYQDYNATWTSDPDLIGLNGTNIPDLDITKEKFIFDDEDKALMKVAELYANQLKEA